MKWLPEWFNDVGFFVTVLGFAFTIPQIIGIKRKIVKKLTRQDNLINIAKNGEIFSETKAFIISENYSLVDKKISELKNVLIACRQVHREKDVDIRELLRSLTDSQQNINRVIINPANKVNFDSELFFSTLDKTRDLFFEVTEKCKYD